MQRFASAFLLALLLTSLASGLVFALFDFPLTGIDDANIYFVYAGNFAGGHGFVYNVGGEKVEGFTSILWTLVCALAFRVSAYPELTLLFLNIVLLSLGIAVALRYLQSHLVRPAGSTHAGLIYSGVFLALLLTAPRYIVWNTITLMENALWSTLLLVMAIFVVQNHSSPRAINYGFVPLMILLILTRPESGLWVVIFLGVLFLRLAAAEGPRRALTALIPSLISFFLCLTVLALFRLAYFGYLAPNTFYAKVSPSMIYNVQQGMGYLFRYTVSDPVVFLTMIAIVVSGSDAIIKILKKQIASDGSRFLPLIAGTGLLVPLLTGGDHFGSFRLYQSIYPIQLLALLFFAARLLTPKLDSVFPRAQQSTFRSIAVAFVLFLMLFQSNTWISVRSEIVIEFQVADYGRKNGAFIQSLFSGLPQLPSLGVVTSGGIKYSYEGEVVDLMGLNNTAMAHNRGDRKGIKNHAAFDIPTFYQLAPDIVWPLTVATADWQYKYAEVKESWENREGFKGLFDEPRFLDAYTYAKVLSTTEREYALVGWFRKALLEQLKARPDLLVEEYPYSPESGGAAAAHALVILLDFCPFS